MKSIIESKFPSGAKTFTLDLPLDAQVLTVRMQGPQPYLVALGEVLPPPEKDKPAPPALKTEARTFALYSNSLLSAQRVGAVAEGAKFVGWFDRGGAPWYVFELPAAKAEKAAA